MGVILFLCVGVPVWWFQIGRGREEEEYKGEEVEMLQREFDRLIDD